MQGQHLFKRLARLFKRLGIGLALPIIILFLTILLVNPSQIVEFTTSIADLSVVIRWLLVATLYGVIGAVLYFNDNLPVIDRLRRNRAKSDSEVSEKPALVQVKAQAENAGATKQDSLLGRVLKSSANRVVKEVANRTITPKEDAPKSASESVVINKLASDDISEDDFYSFLQTIQAPEAEDDETSTSSR